MKVTTKEQRRALYSIWRRDNERPALTLHLIGTKSYGEYLKFRRTAVQSHMGCMMLPWKGMWLGIEPDGYTHS
jgi:hypothetical protein